MRKEKIEREEDIGRKLKKEKEKEVNVIEENEQGKE